MLVLPPLPEEGRLHVDEPVKRQRPRISRCAARCQKQTRFILVRSHACAHLLLGSCSSSFTTESMMYCTPAFWVMDLPGYSGTGKRGCHFFWCAIRNGGMRFAPTPRDRSSAALRHRNSAIAGWRCEPQSSGAAGASLFSTVPRSAIKKVKLGPQEMRIEECPPPPPPPERARCMQCTKRMAPRLKLHTLCPGRARWHRPAGAGRPAGRAPRRQHAAYSLP